MNIGENLKALQDKAGMTTAQLAEKANLPIDTINKIRSGATRNPNADTLARLASALDAPIEHLIGDELPSAARSGLLPDNTMYQLYIAAMARQKESYELTIDQLTTARDQTISHLERGERRWSCIALALIALVVFVLLWDITHPAMGYIQY